MNKCVDELIFKPQLYELIQYYYYNCGNPNGGNCHIVLDDGNLDDQCIWYCQEQCEKNNDNFGYLIMLIMRQITFKEREKLYNKIHNIK